MIMEAVPEINSKEPASQRTVKPTLEKTSLVPSSREEPLRSISEVRTELHEYQGNRGRPKEKQHKTDGFEPFVGGSSNSSDLFINGYNGNFAQHMELNRKGIERVLKVAHLDGKVVLTSSISSRKPSTESQGNELVAKRKLFFGEKIEDDDKAGPFHRVISTPDGWRIEVNDTRIRKELEKKKLTGRKLQKEFVKAFNNEFVQGVWGCVWREKFTSAKVKNAKLRMGVMLFFNIGVPLILSIPYPSPDIITRIGWVAAGEGAISLALAISSVMFGETLRHYDALWERFMPFVEVDKVGRTFLHLSLKNKTLVRER